MDSREMQLTERLSMAVNAWTSSQPEEDREQLEELANAAEHLLKHRIGLRSDAIGELTAACDEWDTGYNGFETDRLVEVATRVREAAGAVVDLFGS